MLVPVSADRRSASVVSIPRDSWVEIPGRGRAKVNAAYSWGGPAVLAGGDLARAARRQNVLRAVLGKLVDVDAFRRLAFLAVLTRSVSVDATLTNSGLRLLALDVRPLQVVFLTAPVRGAGSEGGRSVVLLEDARAATPRSGTAAAYAQQHPDALLGPAPAGEEHP